MKSMGNGGFVGAPWDLIPYFRAPKETPKTLNALTATQLCLPDPMRVVLIFGSISTNAWQLTLNQNGNAGVSGIAMINTAGPVILTFWEHGFLVSQAWFGIASGPVPCTVIEQALTSWPDEQGISNQIQETDGGKFNGRTVFPANSNGRRRFVANSWLQRKEETPYGLPDFGNPRLP